MGNAGAIGPLRVFYSYAHEDEWQLEQLRSHLASLRRGGLITDWFDRRLLPGDHWPERIGQELEKADLFLLLLSPAFVDSEHCWDEFKRAQRLAARHLLEMVPVLGREVHLDGLPDLRNLQWTPSQAIASADNVDKAFKEVASAVYGKIQTLQNSACDADPDQVWNVPYAQNIYFTGRAQILAEVEANLPLQAVGLVGPTGVGKTAIAVEYAHRHRFDHRVVWWVRANDQRTINNDFSQLGRALGLPAARAAEQGLVTQAVHDWLATNDSWLLILDNLQFPEAVFPLLHRNAGGHIIMTAPHLVAQTPCYAQAVAPWSRDEAVAFVCTRTRQERTTPEILKAANTLAETLGDMPLALEQVSAAFLTSSQTEPVS